MSTLRVYRTLVQRSSEWYEARAGLVTASAVGKLITVSTPGADAYECPECAAPPAEPCISLRGGAVIKTMHSLRVSTAAVNAAAATPVLQVADNDTSRGYITTLAAERITGHVEDGPTTSDMLRGIDSEPFAQDAYEAHHGVTVQNVGFMVHDFGKYRIGYSPDGLVGDDGLTEWKAPRAKSHITTVLADEVPAHYMAQLQTALLVSGRQWIDYVSFHGGMALYTKRVHPDERWFDAIVDAAVTAEDAITDITTRYEAATVGLPLTERIPDLIDTITF